jgi:dCTP deaminase
MLLSYVELVELVEQGVINAPLENINASSIDLTLDDVLLVEREERVLVDLANKESITVGEYNMMEVDEDEDPSLLHSYYLHPGEFVLASSREVFNLPNNVSAEYKLKSSMARNGLEHLNAGWCDAGWHGSKLTLELKNMTQDHTLILRPGMKIGQVVFFKHTPVPDHASYAARGRYNNQSGVTAAKGIV